MDNIKVYKINDCDYFASKWDNEKTLKWYIKEYDSEIFDNSIEECETDIFDNLIYSDDGDSATFREFIEAEGEFEEPIFLAGTEY